MFVRSLVSLVGSESFVEKILWLIIYHTHMICTFIAFHCFETSTKTCFPLSTKNQENEAKWNEISFNQILFRNSLIEVIGNWSNIIRYMM